MVGILSYGTYLPRLRLRQGTKNWASKSCRTAANFDEDAVTMAVAALGDALKGTDRGTLDALYLASATLPYAEKQSASLVATASDLRSNIVTADFAHSVRSGTLALRAALDSVVAGTNRQTAVVASDCRLGAPGSDLESTGGDGAAALVFGSGQSIARIVTIHSIVNEILDVWRADGEKVLRVAEDRFRFEEGYLKSIQSAVASLLEKTGGKINEFDKVILYAPDARRHAEAVVRFGLDPNRVQNPFLGEFGSMGSAHVFLQLVAALEEASPGQRFLVVSYGDGADAMVVETTEAIADFPRTLHRGVCRQVGKGATLTDYYDYLRWRGVLRFAGESSTRPGPAPYALHREQAGILRFRGVRCRSCGMVQYPAQRVCVRCRKKDDFDSVRLSESTGRLFSYSMDYVAGTPELPLVHSVVDFDIGGRAMMMMTDRDVAEVKVGMPVEPTFRKLSETEGIHTYLWKVAPIRP